MACILDAQLSLFPSRKWLLWEITQNGWPGATGMQTTHTPPEVALASGEEAFATWSLP